MVKVVIGNIFESKAQTLTNTVNCVGVMGKGVALDFKKHFPDMFQDYVRRCERHEVKLGEPYLYKRVTPPWILNFPTKDHWRSVARLEDIVRGLKFLEQRYREWGITSLAVPPLGCGQGQLDWRVVGPALYRELKKLDIPVILYAPFGTPHEELQPSYLDLDYARQGGSDRNQPKSPINPAWLALVQILSQIEAEPYHWPVGRITFQKIAYFATESGIPTNLEYRRGSYGPYAEGVVSLVTKLVNNGLIVEQRLGKMFAVKVGPTYHDATRALGEELSHWRDAIDRVADFFMRMNTQQAEIAATVHFAAKELAEKKPDSVTESEVLNEVLRWKQKRRPPLNPAEVATSIRHLAVLGWLSVQPSTDLPIEDESLLAV